MSENEQDKTTTNPNESSLAAKQTVDPSWFYTWFVRLEGKLDNLVDKTHSIDRDVAVIKERTNDLPAIRSNVTAIEKAICDLPEIRTDVKYLTKRFWVACGIISAIVFVVQLLAAGLVAYLVRSNTLPFAVTPSLSTPHMSQSFQASPETAPASDLSYQPDSSLRSTEK